MDTWLAVASKRDTRGYSARPVPEEAERRILDAGRLAGSAMNRQPWRFLIVESAEVKERLADSVYAPDNVRGAQLVIAVVGKGSMDVGRCAQNMMLAAWNDSVVSCPNGFPDVDAAAAVLGLEGEERPATVLTFGYPAKERDPESRSPEEWSARADRKLLDELVERI